MTSCIYTSHSISYQSVISDLLDSDFLVHFPDRYSLMDVKPVDLPRFPSFPSEYSLNADNLLQCPKCSVEFHLQYPDYADIYDKAIDIGLPNHSGATISLNSPLSIYKWRLYLLDYADKDIVNFLDTECSIGYDSKCIPESVLDNHGSAICYKTTRGHR